VLVACLGDVMLDVIVEMERPLRTDDDAPALITFSAGGQAANVAAWVSHLGGSARVYGPRSDGSPGVLVEQALSRHGVEVWGEATGRAGAVVSMVAEGVRSMASDPGDVAWLDGVQPGPWLAGADWLFVSGYALLRSTDPQRLLDTATVARAHGSRIAVDLASATMIADFGASDFATLCESLRPAAVFANDAEWASGAGALGGGGTAVLVLKHGRDGASFVIEGVADHRSPVPGPVVDVTGAGDALAAGFLVGGVDLAMRAAARCVAQRGAQPQQAGS
jgi:sugar/nucleoside kinase (ribokinase family)